MKKKKMVYSKGRLDMETQWINKNIWQGEVQDFQRKPEHIDPPENEVYKF